MSSGFAGVPGWRSRTRGDEVGRGFRARAGRVGRAARRGAAPGDESPANARGAPCSTVAWANSASTAPQLSPAFSTCPPGASLFLAPPTTLLATLRRARPTTSRAPANSHWPRRIDATANPPLLPPPPPCCILLFYLSTLYDDDGSSGGRCMRSFSLLFFCNILTTLHARTRPGGRSPRSYLRYVVPIIFLLFRHRYLHHWGEFRPLLFVLAKLAASPG